MATYVVGDIQGCFQTLQKLLRGVAFDEKKDSIWCTGDLVNRGPFSLEVLRYAISLGDRITSVLGNHDLHLIQLAAGIRAPRKQDTLDRVLQSTDLSQIVDWLRSRPLLHREHDKVLVHAGLHPRWSLQEAEDFAGQIESGLRSESWKEFLSELYPAHLNKRPSSLRDALQALTRIRMCQSGGDPEYDYTGPPQNAPQGLKPWFDFPARKTNDSTFLFGHWAALGLRIQPGIVALDTGCVWGKKLTAYRLEDGRIFQEPTADPVAR